MNQINIFKELKIPDNIKTISAKTYWSECYVACSKQRSRIEINADYIKIEDIDDISDISDYEVEFISKKESFKTGLKSIMNYSFKEIWNDYSRSSSKDTDLGKRLIKDYGLYAVNFINKKRKKIEYRWDVIFSIYTD